MGINTHRFQKLIGFPTGGGTHSAHPRDRHVIWLPRHRLAYIRVPKAANSSIRYGLAERFQITSKANSRANKDHFWAHVADGAAATLTPKAYQQKPECRTSWCFSFVRHPVARLYSSWNNKVVENKEVPIGFARMGLSSGQSFADFVARVAAVPDAESDIHVRSQWSILSHDNHLVPDFIGRVETIAQDWDHVRFETRLRCGVDPGPLARINMRARARPDIASSLPTDLLAKIHARYEQDFQLFYPDG